VRGNKTSLHPEERGDFRKGGGKKKFLMRIAEKKNLRSPERKWSSEDRDQRKKKETQDFPNRKG